MAQERKRGISFAEQTDGESTDEVVHTVVSPATIEQIHARIYPGPENELELVLQHRSRESSQWVSLITHEGKQFLDGDNDTWEFDVAIPVAKDDEIRVVATNNATEEYDWRVNMDVDELGGVRRAIRRLL